jgi:hypothetical protein
MLPDPQKPMTMTGSLLRRDRNSRAGYRAATSPSPAQLSFVSKHRSSIVGPSTLRAARPAGLI